MALQHPSQTTSLIPSPPQPSSSSPSQTTTPLFTYPPEIRNLIYKWTFITSRLHPPEYNIPDFVIHGTRSPTSNHPGFIRWSNIPSFPLLLTSKRVFLEALPVISAQAYMEVKIYTDDRLSRRERKAWAVYSTLLRTRALCQDVRKIVLNLTPVDMDVEFCFQGTPDAQIVRLGKLLQTYERLKELTLVIRTGCLVMDVHSWDVLGEHLFVLADKKGRGVSLCVELVDYEMSIDEEEGYDYEEMEEMKEEREFAEKVVNSTVERFCGKGSDVWVEWTFLPDIVDY
ncbi:hypothetical protein GLAREA_09231 [Glarea lozoyensis ATCC 20868]|uniref:Uncharacterized protein n=1 Tax=Glarea lozoyensis (strain ATCC 20868 / MF5171) TaxID=1116229 RepID=S3EFV1_GLAL2|nr:uncharacterized protein GLAREA_09231 [Glarea lozoyensis ATCC 20868]EPE37068.1 hypothetical protein GLAREA_09231 [Glarea lozoyensis ATCC 20868]